MHIRLSPETASVRIGCKAARALKLVDLPLRYTRSNSDGARAQLQRV